MRLGARLESMADLSGAPRRLDEATGGLPAAADGKPPAAERTKPAARSWSAIAESIAIGLLLPAIGWLVNRRDPFLEARPFSWFVLPPLLAGLRHGFAAGCASAATLGASLIVGWRLHVFGGAAFPGEALIGMLTAAMVTGHVSDVWLRETVRTRSAFDHASRRANEFARAHFLLQLSHERLQEQSPGVANLRDALDRIASLSPPGPLAWPTVAPQLLALAARFGSVETATLVQVENNAELGAELGALGHPGPVSADDPMVRDALRLRHIACVGETSDDAAIVVRPAEGSPWLAVIPVLDAGGALHAVLCVQALPFFAFTRKNLEALALLVGHFADRVAARGEPLDPARERARAFEEELGRAIDDCRDRGAAATLGLLAVGAGTPLAGITDLVLTGLLEPTHIAYRTKGRRGGWLLWLLLLDAGEADVRVLVARIEDLTTQELERTLAEAGGTAAFRLLTPVDEPSRIMADLERDLEARRSGA
jgi:hypothetical protein